MCLSRFLLLPLYFLQNSATSFRIIYKHVHNLVCRDVLRSLRRELPLGQGGYFSQAFLPSTRNL
jgi:hypothetical protein